MEKKSVPALSFINLEIDTDGEPNFAVKEHNLEKVALSSINQTVRSLVIKVPYEINYLSHLDVLRLKDMSE